MGETIDEMCSFIEYRRNNIFMMLVLIFGSVYSIIQAIEVGIFWYFLAISFSLGSIYYMLNSRITMIYAITKYRIIRTEKDLVTSLVYKKSSLAGFSDLHYEHVESISIGPPNVKIPQLYLSVFGIAFGWMFLEMTKDLSLLPSATNAVNLFATLLIIASVLNLFFTLPVGGIRLSVKSISGTILEFPERNTHETFISQLLINCRTFLSYGAE